MCMPNLQLTITNCLQNHSSLFSLPLNCPAQATEQLFHSQCWQSIDSVQPGNPLAALLDAILFRFSQKGGWRYSVPNLVTTSLQNSFRESRTKFSDTCKYSSSSSAAVPNQSILIAATTRRNGKIPSVLKAFCLQTRTSVPEMSFITRLKADRCILNRVLNE